MTSKKKVPEKEMKKNEEKGSLEELKRKIEELENDLKESEKKAEKFLNQLKYAKADLENMQKQNQKRLQEIIERANGKLLEQLLPIADELLLLSYPNSEQNKLQEGISMVYKKLNKLMETEGIKPIKAKGEPFDPYKHEAIMEIETEEHPEGSVAEEIRGGYMFKDRVLRPSVVKVARSLIKKVENQNE
jgi:molecular chaperone GrpE